MPVESPIEIVRKISNERCSQDPKRSSLNTRLRTRIRSITPHPAFRPFSTNHTVKGLGATQRASITSTQQIKPRESDGDRWSIVLPSSNYRRIDEERNRSLAKIRPINTCPKAATLIHSVLWSASRRHGTTATTTSSNATSRTVNEKPAAIRHDGPKRHRESLTPILAPKAPFRQNLPQQMRAT